jgi:hypothetical protein
MEGMTSLADIINEIVRVRKLRDSHLYALRVKHGMQNILADQTTMKMDNDIREGLSAVLYEEDADKQREAHEALKGWKE